MTTLTAKEMYHLLRRGNCAPQPKVPDHLRGPIRDIHCNITGRGWYRKVLDMNAVNGKIGIVASGMDCDCTQYYYERIMDAPSGAIAFMKMDEEHRDSLDGPENMRYVRPNEVEPQHKSSDRALEAYENGSMHSVTWASWEDMR